MVEESTDHLPQPATITLRDARLAQQLGLSIDSAEVDEMLSRLVLLL